MRFSTQTIVLALVSSSVVMTDVFAAPVKQSGATSNGVAQQASQDLVENLALLYDAVDGMAALVATVEAAVAAIDVDILTITGDSGSGNATSGAGAGDSGQSSGSGDNSSNDSDDNGAAGDGTDDASRSTRKERRDRLTEACDKSGTPHWMCKFVHEMDG